MAEEADVIGERLIRLEEEVKALRNDMDHRFEGIDRRFDDLKDFLKIYFIILSVIVAIAGILVPVLIRVIP